MTHRSPAAATQVLNELQHGVRVEFHWINDRYSHTISGIRNGEGIPLLKSIDGTRDDNFPPSPPLTELHQQDDTILLTGATTVGHWSMSVGPAPFVKDADESLDDQFRERFGLNAPGFSDIHLIQFDVACRLRNVPGTLQSQYRRADSEVSCGPLANSAFAGGRSGEVNHAVIVSSTLQQQPSNCRINCDWIEDGSGNLTITPTDVSPATFPATVRWKYNVVWSLG